MEINRFIHELKSRGFNTSSVCSIYNPMERFTYYVSTKEIVHSKIIADLLDPTGEHQLGYLVLSELLKKIGIKFEAVPMPNAPNPITDLVVQTEYSAPTTLDGIFYDGRIDIFVRFTYNDKSYAIIIENKLNDAPDQYHQLERYNNFVKERFGSAIIRKTIYMPRIGNVCEYPDAIVINATHLSEIIDRALAKSISPCKNVIQAYSYYLRNISINNINMNNSKILAEMSTNDIYNAKAIKEAYDKLPEAFAEKLQNIYSEKGYEAQIAPNYPSYCYIWKNDSYTRTHLWLAVGFTHESCYIYIVSNDNATYNCYANSLNVSESSKSYGNIWLKPNEDSFSHIPVNGSPDFDGKLKNLISKWLGDLDRIEYKP